MENQTETAAVNPTRTFTDKAEESVVNPSTQACLNILDELRTMRPSGRPLAAVAGSTGEVDLSRILFKQENEWGPPPTESTNPQSLEIGDMRPGLYGHRSGFQRDRAETTEDATFVARPDYFNTMQNVFGNSRYFDLMRNHNQSLSTPGDLTVTQLMNGERPGAHSDQSGHAEHSHTTDRAQLRAATDAIQARPDVPTTLLNFDSHSDLWQGSVQQGNENIAQWVNGVLRENPNINDVYWVLPENFKTDPALRQEYFPTNPNGVPEDHVFIHAGADSRLYFNTATAALSTTRPEGYSENDPNYRVINFHKRTLSDLPDFSGQRTAVSIDLDFFDNRGFDTGSSAQVPFTGDEGFRRLVQTMDEKHLRPEFTTVSASPEYVRTAHMRELLRFSTLVDESTGNLVDGIAVASQNQVNGDVPHTGIRVDRADIPGLVLTNALFENDSRTRNPDDSINLDIKSQELQAALAATRQIYGSRSNREAMGVLRTLDRADGNENGTLEFEAIESLVVRVCKAGPTQPLSSKNPGGE